MGHHSSDDSESSHSRRRRRRSRSRSYERGESKEKRGHKKSKQRHRSPSSSDQYHRSRSSSYERSHRSHKRSKRSRSRSTERSYSSRSRNTKQKSSHRSRSSSRSHTQSKHSASKSSNSRRKSRSRSRGRSYSSESDDSSGHSSQKPASLKSSNPSSAFLDYLSNAKKAEAKVQVALKAAAATDEVLKGNQSISSSNTGWRLDAMEDQQKRANAIELIDSEGFTQESFKSTRSEIPMPKGTAADASHAGAMFGKSSSSAVLDSNKPKTVSQKVSTVMEKETMMHPNLFFSAEEKMDRWIQKLMELRRKKLLETGGIIP